MTSDLSPSTPTGDGQSREEPDLVRLVRALVHALREQVVKNAGTPVSLDYREETSAFVPIAKVPSLTLLGPDVRENRLYASNEAGVRAVTTEDGGVVIEELRPPVAVDLRFAIEVVTNTSAEHFRFVVALTVFFHRNPYLRLARDPRDPSAGSVRFPLVTDGDARTAPRLDEPGRKDDRHVLSWALVVRGFPIDDAIATCQAPLVSGGLSLRARVLDEGGAT